MILKWTNSRSCVCPCISNSSGFSCLVMEEVPCSSAHVLCCSCPPTFTGSTQCLASHAPQPGPAAWRCHGTWEQGLMLNTPGQHLPHADAPGPFQESLETGDNLLNWGWGEKKMAAHSEIIKIHKAAKSMLFITFRTLKIYFRLTGNRFVNQVG